jgi:hypothetical protein
VNRIWKKLFGRGLVEPIDVMENESWEPRLLEWLASDFVDHGYDLQHLLRRILASRTYQLLAAPDSAARERDYVFHGPVVRKLTAEQFLDGVSAVTGEWRAIDPADGTDGRLSRDWRLKLTPLASALGRPFRDQVFTSRGEDPTTLQALELANGATLASLLHDGAARMLGNAVRAPANLFDSGDLRSETRAVDIDVSDARELRLLIRDTGSYEPGKVLAGWGRAELDSPQGVVRLTDLQALSGVRAGPLHVKGGGVYADSVLAGSGSELIYDIAGKGFMRFRAQVGVDQSSLQSAIGPKVRFFVFTTTPDPARLVRVSGEPPGPFQQQKWTPRTLVSKIYRHAVAREPSAEEYDVAVGLLADSSSPTEISPKGLESLLWAVFASPEFQFVR